MTRLTILTVALFTSVLLCSCGEDCRPGVLQITGRWAGVAEGYLHIWPRDAPRDAEVLLTVNQHNSTVSGTLFVVISCNSGRCIGVVDTLLSGTFLNRELVFTLRHEMDNLEREFTGYLEHDRIDGIWKGRQLSTGEVRLSGTWHVERVD